MPRTPNRGTYRTLGKNGSIPRSVGQDHAFVPPSKVHFMVSHHITQTQRMHPDLTSRTRTDEASAPVSDDVLQLLPTRPSYGVSQAQSRPRRRVSLVMVMLLDDLDIRVYAQDTGCARGEVRQQRDAEGEVARLKDDGVCRCGEDRIIIRRRQTGRAEYPGDAVLLAPGGVTSGGLAVAEIDEDVYRLGVDVSE